MQVPVQGPRNLVIYTSREGSWSRDVANERFIIDAMRTLLAKTGTCSIVFFFFFFFSFFFILWVYWY